MEKKLTSMQAFKAMDKFLDIYYQNTKSDDVGSLLVDMQIASDGNTFDPAAWGDWIECIEAVFNDQDA